MSSPNPDSVKQSVRAATLAAAVVQLGSQIVSVLTLAALYRLVTPEDFGIFGMVLPFIFLIRNLATFGLNVPTVQAARLADAEVSSLFWFNLLLGSAAALVTVLAAPLLAGFYDEPRVRAMTLALAGTSLAVALGAQHQALLERKLKLARLAVLHFIGYLVGSVVAVAAGLAGLGMWALVLQQYGHLLALVAGAWLVEPWRPGRPWAGPAVWRHLRLGGYFAASGVAFFLSVTLDKVLVGRLVGGLAVGLYSQAFNLMMKPVNSLTTPLNRIVLAALSRTADDPASRAVLIAGFYRLLAVVLLPVSAGLALVGDLLVVLLGGTEWAAAGPLLCVLSLAMFGQGLVHLSIPIYAAAGRTRALFVAASFLGGILAVALIAGWQLGIHFGNPTLGIAWAYSLTLLIVSMPYTACCLGVAGHRLRLLSAALGGPLVATLAMAVAVGLFQGVTRQRFLLPLPLQLAAEVALGAAVYTLLARRELRWFVQQIRTLAG